MITIRVTSDRVGRAHHYSERGRKGKRTLVSSYRMFLGCREREYHFAVTRDTVFGPSKEVPSNKEGVPYEGLVREDGHLGFRIQLFERGLSSIHLQGTGSSERSYIQIHKGPGMSQGCFLIAGGKRGHARFERIMKRILQGFETPVISIYVEARTGT